MSENSPKSDIRVTGKEENKATKSSHGTILAEAETVLRELRLVMCTNQPPPHKGFGRDQVTTNASVEKVHLNTIWNNSGPPGYAVIRGDKSFSS